MLSLREKREENLSLMEKPLPPHRGVPKANTKNVVKVKWF